MIIQLIKQKLKIEKNYAKFKGAETRISFLKAENKLSEQNWENSKNTFLKKAQNNEIIMESLKKEINRLKIETESHKINTKFNLEQTENLHIPGSLCVQNKNVDLKAKK